MFLSNYVTGDLHRLVELVLGDALHAGVDAGDDVRTGLGRVALGLSDDAAEVVDLVAGDAGLAAQFLVVLALQAGAADLVGAQIRRVGVLGLGDLVVGDGREIAEHLRGVGPAGGGVAAYGLGLGGDAGEVLGALADLQGLLGGGLVGDGDRLVGRAVPAGLRRLGVAEPDLLHDVLGLHAEDAGELGEDGLAVVLHLQQVGARGGDHEPGLVVGDRHPAGVQDRAAYGGTDDLLDVVAGGLLGVLVAVADLEVPEASAEGAEEGEYENLDDDESDLDPWGPTGLGDVGHCCCLPLSVCVRVIRVHGEPVWPGHRPGHQLVRAHSRLTPLMRPARATRALAAFTLSPPRWLPMRSPVPEDSQPAETSADLPPELVSASGSFSARLARAISPGTTNGASSRSYRAAREQQAGEAHMAGGGVADEGADTGVQQGGSDRGGDDHGHRSCRGLELAVVGLDQAGQIADDAQHEGVAPGGVVGGRGEVGEEAGAEADEGAADMAVDHGEGQDGQQQQVGDGAREVESGEDAHLDHQGDDHQGGGEQHPVETHGDSAPTALAAGRRRARSPRG